MSKLLSVTEAAKEAHVTDIAIRKAIARGRLKAERLTSGWVITREDFNTWMKTKRHQKPRLKW